METKKHLMTYEGLKRHEEELQELKVVRRKEIAQKIKEAREQGDLSENAEYDAAKEEQREIEARIEELENLLQNAEVADDEGVKKGTIAIGSKVKLRDITFKEDVEYKIVGSTEADSMTGRISNESPLGRELLGKKTGDEIVVSTHAGDTKYKVLEVRKDS